jgi:thiol-disulfide isomerase/thioredoxin
MMPVTQEPPDALLFIAPGCPHCPTVLQAMTDLVKQALVGRLEVINIAVHPQRAEQLGVRSAPWLQLGEFVLEGLHSPRELRDWAQKANTPAGLADYFSEQLKSGRLPQVSAMINSRPERLSILLQLAEDPDTELTVRIGISAVVEDMTGRPELVEQLPVLERLAASGDSRVRADACHFLALTESREAQPLLERLSKDKARSVRETALDCLEELKDKSLD